jgi:hypothetical protein
MSRSTSPAIVSILAAATVFAITVVAALAVTVPLPAAVFERGDANADGTVNISDPITVLGFLFLGAPTALACEDAADTDDSGALNITDPFYLLGFLFLGGPAPPAPHETRGPDPTPDAFDCASFPPCPQEPESLDPPELDPLPAALAAETVLLTGRAAAGATVEVAGGARLATGPADASGRFAVEVELLPNRLNRLFAAAVIGERRSAPSSAEVIHDAERPAVFVDEPRDGARLIAESVVVAGRVSDRLTGALGLEVSIDGREAEVVIGIGTNGTYELQCPLALGENLFTVTARDFVGNEAEASVRVVREPAEGSERIEVVSGGGQEAPITTLLAEPVVVRRISAAGAPVAGADLTFAVVRSDGLLSTAPGFEATARTIRARSGADGTARVHWRLGTDAGCGNNRLEVTADGLLIVLATPSPFAPLPVQLLVAVRNGEALGIGQFAIVDTDSDGDLLVDSYEMRLGLDPAAPGDADGDEDGIRDLEEALFGTHPLIADTDGDGLSDGFELDQGSDPLAEASILPSFAPRPPRGRRQGECQAAEEPAVVSVNGQ